ncbi:MAG: twitching motility protein PilT [Deltaproteobacteria bacterium HGW-Deltaproteobacteria-20]|nr:MAG: twitching motility protein PilT [Deltaproteobacteria bacterium HGW-Deltaproteobacteria-20]
MSSSPYASPSFLQQLLSKAVAAGASDVHLKVGQPPGARVRGRMVYFRMDSILPDDTDAAATTILQEYRGFTTTKDLTEVDTSYAVAGVGRFRVNVYRQRGSLAIVMRSIPLDIPTFEQLGCPEAAKLLAEKDRGMIIVVGAAGNGKSSTLAAMIGHMNRTRPIHVVTIEDPIEFLHKDDMASISQREVGMDTPSFAVALRAALRQDPDVILVGEIRDQETMDIALKAAETGHLVLTTLHTPDVTRTINRMLALFDLADSSELRDRIADSLQGIIAQRLLPKQDGEGLVLTSEVLVMTGTARESIRRPEGNPALKEVMEKGVHPYGMQTFAMDLKRLVQQGLVSKDVARAAAGF